MSSTVTNSETSTDRVICFIKWFNNKNGYGFGTTCDDRKVDVFIHHTSLSVGEEQYRYLVQGEYVELSLEQLTEGKHKWQATNVTGINGGRLMCETKFVQKKAQEQYERENEGNGSKRTVKSRGSGPRGSSSAHEESAN
tara:strand:- start:302 stop:718 length:417 start_codon:yes stop_codon:yes gene_type:complete